VIIAGDKHAYDRVAFRLATSAVRTRTATATATVAAQLVVAGLVVLCLVLTV
jgi:hypothetical protein